MPIPIASRDRATIPSTGGRSASGHSLLTNGPRLACNPPNAILNYLYALLEAETTLACHAVGLDPLLGIFHTDQRYRASLALDAMEAVRPIVDAYVLALLTQRTLAARGLRRDPPGRLPAIARASPPGSRKRSTPGGTTSRRSSRESRSSSPKPAERSDDQQRRSPARSIAPRGTSGRQTESADSLVRRRQPCRTPAATAGAPARPAQALLRALPQREVGSSTQSGGGRTLPRCSLACDPSNEIQPTADEQPRSAGERTRPISEPCATGMAHRADPAVFRTEILPGLRGLAINDLVAATGLSNHYCSLIRLGKRVPHARHWEALRRLAS